MAVGFGAASLVNVPVKLKADIQRKYPHDRVMLGDTGIETSRLAIGTGSRGGGHSSNQTRQLGIKGLSELFITAYNDGINFWDSADSYGSHPHMREALKTVPRDKVVILTKSTSRSADGMHEDLNRFLKEIGTGYLDIVLLHAVTDPGWRTSYRGALEALAEAREKGFIRAIGISCHSFGALKEVADEPLIDVDLVRWNPGEVMMDSSIPAVQHELERMNRNGKGIVGMKVYGEGRLTHMKDQCLQFQLQHHFIHAFTLGLESMEQLRDIRKRLPEASISV